MWSAAAIFMNVSMVPARLPVSICEMYGAARPVASANSFADMPRCSRQTRSLFSPSIIRSTISAGINSSAPVARRRLISLASRASAASAAASIRRSYSSKGMSTMRSPLGVVMILGLFIVLVLVSAAARAHLQHVQNNAIPAEDDAPITNAQPIFVLVALKLLDVVGQACGVRRVLPDFPPDQLRRVGSDPPTVT